MTVNLSLIVGHIRKFGKRLFAWWSCAEEGLGSCVMRCRV
jgi:hypothetical protein